MANIKECSKCKSVKETTQFSKCSARMDGLQDKCKSCNKVDNLKFREEINPQHHAEWQRNNQQVVYRILKKHRKADKSPVMNVDLWQTLDAAQEQHQISWRWIKGHAGHEGNERADTLANRGVEMVL